MQEECFKLDEDELEAIKLQDLKPILEKVLFFVYKNYNKIKKINLEKRSFHLG